MLIHIYLFIVYFIKHTSTQRIKIHAVFSEENDFFSNSDESVVSTFSAIPFVKNTTTTCKSYDTNDNYLMLKDNNHVPKEICACVKIVQVVNPYKHLVPFKVFNTAHMQCAICLSISKQIQTTLGEYQIGLLNPKVGIEKLKYGIQFFCKKHFNVLHLRDNLQRFRDIAKILKYATNEIEENWSPVLNQICNKYTDHINVVNFYNVLLEKTSSISTFLCRRDGVFRDCANIQMKHYYPVSFTK